MMVHKLCKRNRHCFCRGPNLGLLTYESITLPAKLNGKSTLLCPIISSIHGLLYSSIFEIPYGSNDGNISKISPLKRLPLVYKVSMWCLREFCVATDPDDKVKILCETIRVTFNGEKLSNFRFITLHNKISFLFYEFSRVKKWKCVNATILDSFPFINFNCPFKCTFYSKSFKCAA